MEGTVYNNATAPCSLCRTGLRTFFIIFYFNDSEVIAVISEHIITSLFGFEHLSKVLEVLMLLFRSEGWSVV